MIPSRFEYTAPDSLTDATGLLTGAGSVPLAGGMSLISDMKLGEATPSLVVDLRRITELRGISRWSYDTLRIGAMTTIAEIARDHGLPIALTEAAASVPDPHVRYRVTIGGNLTTADRGAEIPPVLLALGATVNLSNGSEQAIPVASYLDSRPEGLVTSIDVPALGEGEVCAVERISPRPARPPRLVVAVWARVADGTVSACRIAAAAQPGWPRLLTQVEQALTGRRLDAESVRDACEHISAEDPLASGPAKLGQPASDDYLAHLTGVLIHRAFTRITSPPPP
jgi:aerobic carbon-monoxide dehydrogenase medium subunit